MPSNSRSSANDSEVLVKVDAASKKFCRDLKKSMWYGIKDVATELNPFKRGGSTGPPSCGELRTGEFWAVNKVSFELRRGECLGLIGHNGAGKTTLLKMLNGLIKPDSGSITMKGRVGALIALGAGFNPILSGRENVFVNGSILGLSKKELTSKLDDIIDFAGLQDFIDSPVQSYSSGMQVRLGFAVATALNPDILILDEVLAVGDAAFRAKCFKRIGSMSKNCAILFVSHDQSQVSRICNKALLMAKGTPLYLGATAEALDKYHEQQNEMGANPVTVQTHDEIEEIEVMGVGRNGVVKAGGPLEIELRVVSKQNLPAGIGIINFVDPAGSAVGQADFSSQLDIIPAGESILKVRIERVDLAQATYTLNLAIFSENQRETLIHAVGCSKVKVEGAPYLWCAYKMPVEKVVVSSTEPLPDAVAV